MKNLESIIDKIEKEFESKDKVREKSLKLAREIIIGCRKAIQKIHQHVMREARFEINRVKKKLQQLLELTKSHPEFYHAGFVENAAQEVVEAYCLYNILQGKDLPDPDELKINYTSYILGLCDLVGELRRVALDNIRLGKTKDADKYLKMMDDIYTAIIRFDYPSGLIPIKRKQDMVRNLIEKTRGELTVASCERQLEYHTNEFRGILDRVESEGRIKKRKRKRNIDLDVDSIL